MRGSHQFLSFSRLHPSVFLRLLLVFLLDSCGQVEPKFTRDYFPEYYQYDSQSTNKNDLEIRLLNGDPNINRQIVNFWLKSNYKNIYRQLHPIIRISRSNLRNLSLFLNQTAKIYYISWSPQKEISLARIKSASSCTPLSNVEIQFLFSGSQNRPFSSNGLAILFISSHELLQQSGAIPVYPQILSDRFRKENQLKPLKTMENFNLFAKKSVTSKKGIPSPGIVICRRYDPHRLKINKESE